MNQLTAIEIGEELLEAWAKINRLKKLVAALTAERDRRKAKCFIGEAWKTHGSWKSSSMAIKGDLARDLAEQEGPKP